MNVSLTLCRGVEGLSNVSSLFDASEMLPYVAYCFRMWRTSMWRTPIWHVCLNVHLLILFHRS